MCLVMKLDNGKVVSIANEQNHRQTELQSHPVADAPTGAPPAPQIFFFVLSPPPKAAVSQMGAEGATRSEGERNSAEDGYFAS